MKYIVIYKSKYGSTKNYAEWIAEELGCNVKNANNVTLDELSDFDVIIYGGGLYGEIINGVNFITKNINKLSDKKIIIFSTGITPLEYREYYDRLVVDKNFRNGVPGNVKIFNFMGKMVMEELSVAHRAALKTLKKIMSSKENPTEMEKLLVELCDADGDFSDRDAIYELIEYAKNNSRE